MSITPSHKKICIVTSGALCSSPRVVKEADALASIGHGVTVVGIHWDHRQAAWDARMTLGRRWRFVSVNLCGDGLFWALRRRLTAIRSRLARWLWKLSASAARRPGSMHLASLAISRPYFELLDAAKSVPADLYIGHNLAALPVVAAIAKMRACSFGFDAEDDHFGQFHEIEQSCVEAKLTLATEAHFLRRASHITCASTLSGNAIAARYGIAQPIPILNCFPAAERKNIDGARRDRSSAALSLYWFSQTIGLDRGLQEVIYAIGMAKRVIELHLRGTVSPDVRRTLEAVAKRAEVLHCLHFHEQVPPSELLSRTAEHDIGLALEQPTPENHGNTISNKIFFYMTAGLAIIASDTPGQRLVGERSGHAVAIYKSGDAKNLASILQGFADDRDRLDRAKSESFALGTREFSWEHEQTKLRHLIES